MTEARDAEGNPVTRHTFRYRPDLLATHQQLKALEQGAVLGEQDRTTAPQMVAQAEAFGRDLYQRLFEKVPGTSKSARHLVADHHSIGLRSRK